MTIISDPQNAQKSHSVLLIGNNPNELSTIYDRIKHSKRVEYITNIFFDVSKALKNLSKFKPSYIVIDDNIGRIELRRLLTTLKGNSKTSEIPVTIIQNSNRDDFSREGAEEFILKNQITSESISATLISSLRVARMQAYLRLAHRKRKKFIKKLR